MQRASAPCMQVWSLATLSLRIPFIPFIQRREWREISTTRERKTMRITILHDEHCK